MREKILITAVNLLADLEQFRAVFDEHDLKVVHPPKGTYPCEEEMLELVGDVTGIIAGDEPVTRRVLEHAPNLRVISRWGTGLDNIDLETCRELDIAVKNIPAAFTVPVADLVMAFVLAFARQISWADRWVRDGQWGMVPARTLQECTLGIIGVGRIGRAVVNRAAGFGMAVLGYDRHPIPEPVLQTTGFRSVSREALLRRADFISLNCDLNPSSYHLIGEAELGMMKPEAVLINTARGGVIDEPALVRALQAGRIAGAGLDVFETEPLPAESPLRTMENVLLSPHNGHSSLAARENAHRHAIDHLLAELKERR